MTASPTARWNRFSLVDKKRSRNTEGKYCYCGQSKGYDHPCVMCKGCEQWFHISCTEVVPRDENLFLPYQINYEFTCKCCNYPSWAEHFTLTKSSWVQTVVSAHSYMTWKTQRDAWKVAEVGNFIEEQWHLLCLDQEKDSHELFEKDKKAGKWRGPLNSYWTTHEKKYFTKPHRGYWGLQDPTPDGFGPALQPCPLLRERGVTMPLPEPVDAPKAAPKSRPKKMYEVDINPQSYEEEEAEQEVYGQQVEDELEAKCGICQLSQRKLGCPERNQIFCFKCDQDQRPSPIPRTATGCVVAEINVPGDDATVKTKVWLCSRCDSKVRREKQFTWQRYGLAQIEIPHKAFIQSLPPEDEVEPWVACDYCEDESTAWYHQRCVAYDKQIYGEAQWCCGQSECRRKHAETVCGLCPSPGRESTEEEVEEAVSACDPRLSAKDLPMSPLSDFLEEQLIERAFPDAPEQSKVTVRVVSNFKDEVSISPRLAKRYKLIPKASFHQKLIFAFYEPPDGREICFFGIQTQEYGPDCPPAQRNVAYLAYIDSANLYHLPQCGAHTDKVGADVWMKENDRDTVPSPCTMEAECGTERKRIYQALLHGYMQYLRLRNFQSMWIWVMPPSAEHADQPVADYMFNYRPSSQHIPNQKQLEKWYIKLLQTAQDAGLVEHFLDNTGLQQVDKEKKEKLKRNIDFAFTLDHNRPVGRSTSPGTAQLVDGSAAAIKTEPAGAEGNSAERANKRRRSSRRPPELDATEDMAGAVGGDAMAIDGKEHAAMAGAAEMDGMPTPASGSYMSGITPTGGMSLSVENLPFFKGDHLHTVADQVLEQLEEKEKTGGRPGALKRTKSQVYAQKVGDILKERSQGSYMVCHFKPPDPGSISIPDDLEQKPRVGGTSLHDRKQLLDLMIQNYYQFNTMRHAKYSTMVMLHYFMASEHSQLKPITSKLVRSRSEQPQITAGEAIQSHVQTNDVEEEAQ